MTDLIAGAIVLQNAGAWSVIAKIPGGLWAFLSAIVILILTKSFEGILKRQSEIRSDRQDYREEIKDLQGRLDSVEEQLRLWRDRYYAEQTRAEGYRVQLVRNGITPLESVAPSPPLAPPVSPPPSS